MSFDWLLNISLTSTSESIRWVRMELKSALDVCSTLEDLLEKLAAGGMHCNVPTATDLCAKATPLLLGRNVLRPLVARLADLSVELSVWEKTLVGNEGATSHLMVAIPIVQTYQAALEKKMLRIQKVRLSVEELLGLGYY